MFATFGNHDSLESSHQPSFEMLSSTLMEITQTLSMRSIREAPGLSPATLLTTPIHHLILPVIGASLSITVEYAALVSRLDLPYLPDTCALFVAFTLDMNTSLMDWRRFDGLSKGEKIKGLLDITQGILARMPQPTLSLEQWIGESEEVLTVLNLHVDAIETCLRGYSPSDLKVSGVLRVAALFVANHKARMQMIHNDLAGAEKTLITALDEHMGDSEALQGLRAQFYPYVQNLSLILFACVRLQSSEIFTRLEFARSNIRSRLLSWLFLLASAIFE